MAINMRVLANGVEVLTDLNNQIVEVYHMRTSVMFEDREDDHKILDRMADILVGQSNLIESVEINCCGPQELQSYIGNAYNMMELVSELCMRMRSDNGVIKPIKRSRKGKK